MRRPLASTPRGEVRQETTMSEQIKSQIISRRRLFWLAAIAVALAAPATMLSTSDARAQQSDQAVKCGLLSRLTWGARCERPCYGSGARSCGLLVLVGRLHFDP